VIYLVQCGTCLATIVAMIWSGMPALTLGPLVEQFQM
jgi:hypothetical protein